MIWLKYKKIFLILIAVAFVVALFFVKNKSVFKNRNQSGLAYDNMTVEELVNKDTDQDGIPDWEEKLWGTDPIKKETTPGIPDTTAIESLKNEQLTKDQGGKQTAITDETKLTQTEKFSREFFSTITALNQNGALDQATIDKITDSLTSQIQNSSSGKVFLLSDIKTTADNSVISIQKYSNSINNIFSKYSTKEGVPEILKEFTGDGNNENPAALAKLGPIIDQTKKISNELLKTNVPSSLASIHLEMINGLEKLISNMNDIRHFDSDVIVSMGGISQYENNAVLLNSIMQNLSNAIEQKLNS